jgi:teichuronic acid biosynthesis glycosyltransferase TuaG
MPNPLISIIMPAYNAAQFMAESIRSVIDQTYTNWELIIINDGSTDDTEAIANKQVLVDRRIRLINQTNKKLSGARNAGIKAATGEWLAFLDSDDLWVPDKLTKQIETISVQLGVGVIFSDGYIFNNDDITNNLPYNTAYGFFSGADMYKLLYQGNYIPVLSVLVKKEYLDLIGLQDENLIACQDWDYWLRLAANDVGFYGMQEKLFYYRRHNQNMSNDNYLILFEKACVFLKNFSKSLFTLPEIEKLKAFVHITICQLIKIGKIKEALFLNNAKFAITKNASANLINFLLSTLKEQSYYLVRFIFKVDKIFFKPVNNEKLVK